MLSGFRRSTSSSSYPQHKSSIFFFLHVLTPAMASSALPLIDGEASKDPNLLRVFFIPFFASGHMLCMLDLARLFAARPGVEAVMVVTDANADLIRPTLLRSAAKGLHVGVLIYPFPAAAAGLPSGKENLSSLAPDEEWRIYRAVDLSEEAHRRLLHRHRPDAVVADIPFHWTTAIAAELGIPRVTFHSVGTFPQCVMQVLYRSPPPPVIGNEPFVVPELPGKPVELVRSELPEFLRSPDFLTEVWAKLRNAQLQSFGTVVNTFYEFEPEYCDWYRENECTAGKAWYVGPVTVSYVADGEGAAAAAERGGVAAAENCERCRRWLDDKEDDSVVFVCLGSWYRFGDEQLREMALGLEASGRPFLWVVRGGGAGEEWLPVVGWEQGLQGRGMVVRGWAPQMAILTHRAVGAFVSHCGWNSVMEAATAGVPVLTWPLLFEQFINERLVTGVQGIGKRVWDGFRSTKTEEKTVLPAASIAAAVAEFMTGGGPSEAARRRVRDYAEKARAAMAEGGSSWKDLNRLIDELRAWRPPAANSVD